MCVWSCLVLVALLRLLLSRNVFSQSTLPFFIFLFYVMRFSEPSDDFFIWRLQDCSVVYLHYIEL